MIIVCSSCNARYQYDEARFEGKASKKIKCAKCGGIFEIHSPSADNEPPAAPAVDQKPKPAAASQAPKSALPLPAAMPASAPPSKGETTAVKTETRVARPAVDAGTDLEEALEKHQTGEVGALQMPEGKRVSLAIIDGPNAGNVLRIANPRVTIGRTGSDVVLDDTEVSRQHATLEIRDSIVTLTDLGSRNGTLIDGMKITEPTELQDKSEFLIGTTTLMFIVTQDAPTLS